MVAVEQLFDLGAQGHRAPMVRSKEQAEAIGAVDQVNGFFGPAGVATRM